MPHIENPLGYCYVAEWLAFRHAFGAIPVAETNAWQNADGLG